MNYFKECSEIFKNYYAEIDLSKLDFMPENKKIEEAIIKRYKDRGQDVPENEDLKRKIIIETMIENRFDQITKMKQDIEKYKIENFLGTKDTKELTQEIDSVLEFYSDIDVTTMTEEQIFNSIQSKQEKLDKLMIEFSKKYVFNLFNEAKNTNNPVELDSAYSLVKGINLPDEARNLFSLLYENEKKLKDNQPQVDENLTSVDTQTTSVQNTQDSDVQPSDAQSTDTQDTGQQTITDNEGSLNETNISQNQPMTLEEMISKIDITSDFYGDQVTQAFDEFNRLNDERRIATLKELREKKGKLTFSQALELRTLVEKQQLRQLRDKAKDSTDDKFDNSSLASVNQKINDAIEKQNILKQEVSVSKGIIGKIKRAQLKKKTEKIAKLKAKQGKLVQRQINMSMLSSGLSEKLLTARVVKNHMVSRFKSIKNSAIESLQDLDGVLASQPMALNVQMYGMSAARAL